MESKPDGRQNWYSLTEDAFDATDAWVDEVQTMWATALGALKKLVEEANNGKSE